MSTATDQPVTGEREFSRIPGGFDSDVAEPAIDTSNSHSTTDELQDLSLSLPLPDEPSSLLEEGENDQGSRAPAFHNTVLEEKEIHNRLNDVESSFLPDISQMANNNTGADDTFLVGVPADSLSVKKRPQRIHLTDSFRDLRSQSSQDPLTQPPSPRTPPGEYKTPAHDHLTFPESGSPHDSIPNAATTSQLETMSSSPMAAAAQRTVSRVQSQATLGGYETANEVEDYDCDSDSPLRKRKSADPNATPRRSLDRLSLSESPLVLMNPEHTDLSDSTQSQGIRRPNYLTKRSSQNRLSYDSVASAATDFSEATLGADFALQSGGALPDVRLPKKPKMALSRSTSLGSIISGISTISEEDSRGKRSTGAPDLSTLEEETPRFTKTGSRSPDPTTPRASTTHLPMPSDTVITKRVDELEVPGTFARQYRQDRSLSPSKNLPGAATPAPKSGLTLKEHRSTVEKLGKENFDLKMKIHFLDQALQRRSEDGVKEMITENVQLKSDRLRLEKDNHSLRKQVRDLQRRLEAAGARDSPSVDQGYGTDDERSPTAEEEIIYLRERLETTEIEVEKLRSESIRKEADRQRLAETLKSLTETKASVSDLGSREERDMWKDMLEAETIAREQSEEDNKKLREDMAKLRYETFGSGRSASRRNQPGSSMVSRSSSVEPSSNHAFEMDRLKHEISELQKTIGAQASALTSRNKEKERLYQEIEDLKLGKMAGVRSVAGESILDRSASRARSHSRASNASRYSKLGDQERDTLESRIDDLRDETSQLKLENQRLQSELDELVADFDVLDQQAQADADEFNKELNLLQQERDNALREIKEHEDTFQALKHEAQVEIDGLGDELDEKVDECLRLQQDFNAQLENLKALQAEMRSASEGLIRLEQDAQHNLAQYKSVKLQLDDSNRELESLEKSLGESENKIQRLTVQQESSRNEIAFLREEQDGDKIKIGDLENLLKKVHLNLESEREKARELERRIVDERQQREAISSQEKQDVQRMINDLNRDAAAAREELRRTKKALSSREIESNSYREKLAELEESLRGALGDPRASRSSLANAVILIQRDLEQKTIDLDSTRRKLDERESLLANRDGLLESSGLEYRKLIELIERERQAHRQDKHSFEQVLKSHQQSARALAANTNRVTELEQARHSDRKRIAQIESQFKEQLSERNQVLLSLWKKLSTICGPDWAHNNSLINGNLPSQEVIGNLLFWPGFSRNLLMAAKQIENMMSTFREKIKRTERDLWKEFQTLEQTLELRTKKLERIEESWEKTKLRQAELEARQDNVPRDRDGSGSRTPRSGKSVELSRLRNENRLLKAELQLVQSQRPSHSRSLMMHNRAESSASGFSGSVNGGMSMDGAVSGGIPTRGSSMRRSRHAQTPEPLQRHHSTNIIEHLVNPYNSNDGRSMGSESGSPERAKTARDYIEQPRDRDRGLMLPNGPVNIPVNGNFHLPPLTQQAQTQTSSQRGPDQTYNQPSNALTLTSHPPTSFAQNQNSSHTSQFHPSHQHSQSQSSQITSTTTATTETATTATTQKQEEKWIHRLRELERRLKSEREARLMDRAGARKRLEERDAVNEELRGELEREREKLRYSIESRQGLEDDEGEDGFEYHHENGGPNVDENDKENDRGRPVTRGSSTTAGGAGAGGNAYTVGVGVPELDGVAVR